MRSIGLSRHCFIPADFYVAAGTALRSAQKGAHESADAHLSSADGTRATELFDLVCRKARISKDRVRVLAL